MGAMLVNSRSPQSGFGLIEVLVALVIFALGVLATYNIQTSALMSTTVLANYSQLPTWGGISQLESAAILVSSHYTTWSSLAPVCPQR